MPERDHEFVEVSIDEFTSGKPVAYPIYIRLSSWKYLQIANPGDGLDRERLKSYQDHNVKCLYLRKEDFMAYISFKASEPPPETPPIELNIPMEAPKLKPVTIVDPNTARRLADLKTTATATLDLMKANGVNDLLFEASKEFVQSTLSVLADDRTALMLLSALNRQPASNAIYEHGLGVSLYSVMLGRVMGWKSSQNLFKVGLGGLLHDIGLNSLDETLLNKHEHDFTPAEKKQYRQHPAWGAEILKKITSVSPDVLAIVSQHHEEESGNGYPLGLIGSKIHELAKVVAVANAFCELVLDSPTSLHLSPQDAASMLAEEHAHAPAVLEALKRIVKGLPD